MAYDARKYSTGSAFIRQLTLTGFPRSQLNFDRSQSDDYASFVALTLGRDVSAPLFFGFVRALSGQGIRARLAVKSALESMVESAQAFADELSYTGGQILSGAFKAANDRLVAYRSSFLSQGPVAARAFAVVLEDDVISIGKVGDFESYLWRDSNLLGFFSSDAGNQNCDKKSGTEFSDMLGVEDQVRVDVSAAHLRNEDQVIATSLSNLEEGRDVLVNLMEDFESEDFKKKSLRVRSMSDINKDNAAFLAIFDVKRGLPLGG